MTPAFNFSDFVYIKVAQQNVCMPYTELCIIYTFACNKLYVQIHVGMICNTTQSKYEFQRAGPLTVIFSKLNVPTQSLTASSLGKCANTHKKYGFDFMLYNNTSCRPQNEHSMALRTSGFLWCFHCFLLFIDPMVSIE